MDHEEVVERADEQSSDTKWVNLHINWSPVKLIGIILVLWVVVAAVGVCMFANMPLK